MNLIKAKTAMLIGQYADAIRYFKKHIDEKPCKPLESDDLNQMSEAYGYVLNQKLSCKEKLEGYLRLIEDSGQERIMAISSMLHKIRIDIMDIFTDVIKTIDKNVLPYVKGELERALAYKIKGDFCRQV